MKRVLLLVVMVALAMFAGVERDHPPKPGKVHALAIGINEYPAGWLANAKFAIADATSVAGVFGKAKGPGLTAAAPEVLAGAQASNARVRQALQEAAHQCSPNDVFVFFFSGQGRPEADERGESTTRYTFALADTVYRDRQNVANGMSSEELSVLLRAIPARRILVILDAFDSSVALDAVYGALNEEKTFTLATTHRKFAFFGLSGPSPELDSLKHGIMTAALLSGLAGEADGDRDGTVTAGELEGYLIWKIPALEKKYLPELTKMYGTEAVKQLPEMNLVSRSNLRELPLMTVTRSRGIETYVA
jgi:uncharacterized caspase-like protein